MGVEQEVYKMDDVMKTNGGCLHDLVTLAIHHRDDPEICADDHRNLFVCDRSPSGGHQQKCGKQRIASSDSVRLCDYTDRSVVHF